MPEWGDSSDMFTKMTIMTVQRHLPTRGSTWHTLLGPELPVLPGPKVRDSREREGGRVRV